MKRLLIIDHFAVFHRARNAMLRTGRSFTTTNGIPTTGVFSYMNIILSIIKQVEPTHVVCCYDAGGNKRKEENSEYKANRGKSNDEFRIESNALLDDFLPALGVEVVGLKGYEADDCIFTIARQAQFGVNRMDEVIIFTCDQDILQCVTSVTSVLLFNSAKKQVMMGPSEVVDKWGCNPEDIDWVKALSGDGSDNIKGIKGIGAKTAIKICHEAQWLPEVILEHKKVKDHAELVHKNLDLVRLRNVHEFGAVPFDDYELGKGNYNDYEQVLSKYECTQLAKRISKTREMMRMA